MSNLMKEIIYEIFYINYLSTVTSDVRIQLLESVIQCHDM